MIRNSFKNFIEKIRKEDKNKKRLLFFIFIFLSFILVVHLSNFLFTKITSAKTYFLGEKISFKNKEEVLKIIKDKSDKLKSKQVILNFEDNNNKKFIKKYELSKLLDIDGNEKVLNNVFNTGFKSFNVDMMLLVKNLFYTKKYNLNYSINNDTIKKIEDEININEVQTENANINIDSQTLEFIIKKEKIGFSYDFKKMREDLFSIINNNSEKVETITISKIIDNPKIIENDLVGIVDSANVLLKNSPISVYYKDVVYKITKENLANWITFEYSIDENSFNEVQIKLKKDNILEYLTYIATENDKEAKNGEIIFEEGRLDKVKTFVPIEKGLSLNKEDSYTKIQDAVLTNKNEVYLTIDEKTPDDINSDVVKYGFLEQIAVGVSDFTGSSTSRIHNISVGSSFVNGTIIKPNEEFSMWKTLGGEITAAVGYVPELVIKGNKTEKEYGGGLCQVGTTMFRTALNGGFPITERRNHSYRVSYYEPAGTDATIYYPSPDFKFFNNTKNHILILTEIKGNKLTYRIWGTRDNRKIKIGEPVITNIVLAPGTKWIETLDLKVGEKRCIESSHNGADAEFSYYVEFDDGSKIDTVFKSRYRPWQAVCLIGVEKLSGYGYGGYGYGY